MEPLLFLVCLLCLGLMMTCACNNSSGQLCLGIIGVIAVLALVSLHFSTLTTHELAPGEYSLREYEFIHPTETGNKPEVVYLKVKVPWLVDTYFYRADCKRIKGGCPSPWYRNFTVVQGGQMLVVVDTTQPTKNSGLMTDSGGAQ